MRVKLYIGSNNNTLVPSLSLIGHDIRALCEKTLQHSAETIPLKKTGEENTEYNADFEKKLL